MTPRTNGNAIAPMALTHTRKLVESWHREKRMHRQLDLTQDTACAYFKAAFELFHGGSPAVLFVALAECLLLHSFVRLCIGLHAAIYNGTWPPEVPAL